jgi:hypothetical protein
MQHIPNALKAPRKDKTRPNSGMTMDRSTTIAVTRGFRRSLKKVPSLFQNGMAEGGRGRGRES